jgi:hypothetical protein
MRWRPLTAVAAVCCLVFSQHWCIFVFLDHTKDLHAFVLRKEQFEYNRVGFGIINKAFVLPSLDTG